MPDAVDAIQELEEADRQAALARFRSRNAAGAGRETCEDCGAPIPPGRRAAQPSATRCIECQLLREGRSA